MVKSLKAITAEREAIISMINGLNYPYALTLNFNDREISEYVAKRRIQLFHQGLDQVLLGNNWKRADPDRKTSFVYTLENVGYNIHAHLAIKPAISNRISFYDAVNISWKRIAHKGDFKIKTTYDGRGWGDYITKWFLFHRDTDRLNFSDC